MKYSLLFLVLGLFCISACNNDDDAIGPNGPDADLRVDGANVTAPSIPQGTYELAVRFPASVTSNFIGRQLEEVAFFIGDVPSTTALGVWSEGTENQPGDIIYDQILNNLNFGTWESHILGTPIEITGEDLWISIQVNHTQTRRSIGCDAGPANANGDFIYDNSTQTWSSFRAFTNGEANINWNIRGILN